MRSIIRLFLVIAVVFVATNTGHAAVHASGPRSAQCVGYGDGVNPVMAALAVAAGIELGRWNPTVDFAPRAAAPWGLELTATGRARCADGKCGRVQAVLDLQRAPATTVQLSGGSSTKVVLNSSNLASILLSRWTEAKNCQLRGGVGDTSCTSEAHKLTRMSSARGTCSESHTFTATSTSGGALRNANQFKNWLMFVGYPSNPAFAFSTTGTTVTVTVPLDLLDDGSANSVAGTNSCTRISTSDLSARACTCGGTAGKYGRSTWNASTYSCR